MLSSIPPSIYGLASSVPTLAVPNYLLAKPDLSDSWAWWTLNTMFRRQNDLMACSTPKPAPWIPAPRSPPCRSRCTRPPNAGTARTTSENAQTS